jgi:hypothetical protein
MAWQAFFILWLVTVHSKYYIEQVYVLRDAIEGVVGYLFLTAMVVTSFRATRQHMKQKTWRLLHLSGIYFLWAYAFSVYWWNIFYYANPVTFDYVFYWGGFVAWALRVAAWNKRRLKKNSSGVARSTPQPVFGVLGIATIALGVFAASSGSLWYGTAENLLTGYAITRIPETYLPYWPFEPWLPLAIIARGTSILRKGRASNSGDSSLI